MNIDISQGSVATHLRCGGIFSTHKGTVVLLQTSDLFISMLESISSDVERDSDCHIVTLADSTYSVLDVS